MKLSLRRENSTLSPASCRGRDGLCVHNITGCALFYLDNDIALVSALLFLRIHYSLTMEGGRYRQQLRMQTKSKIPQTESTSGTAGPDGHFFSKYLRGFASNRCWLLTFGPKRRLVLQRESQMHP